MVLYKNIFYKVSVHEEYWITGSGIFLKKQMNINFGAWETMCKIGNYKEPLPEFHGFVSFGI